MRGARIALHALEWSVIKGVVMVVGVGGVWRVLFVLCPPCGW